MSHEYEGLTVRGLAAVDAFNDAAEDAQRRVTIDAQRLPAREPWVPSDRAAIVEATWSVLALELSTIPAVRIDRSRTTAYDGYTVERIEATTWPRCRAAAHLYLPQKPAAAPVPLVLLFCGHSDGGKEAPAYRAMARLLARTGAAVLVPDNIGQGERVAMGHWNVTGPFEAGLTLQGLIVAEAIAWLEWSRTQDRFDPQKIAAIGNSGGGQLAMFLAALESDRLAAVSASGCLSSFEMLARKEWRLCSCCIFPGAVGRVEMWEMFAAFAPRPLLLFQGLEDEFFSNQHFRTATRRVHRAYAHAGADRVLSTRVFAGGHSWNDERRAAIQAFLQPVLGLRQPAHDAAADQDAQSPGACYDAWPSEALNADGLSSQISGRRVSSGSLAQVFLSPELESSVRGLRVGGFDAAEVLATMLCRSSSPEGRPQTAR